jgi:hypothetical protein
MDINSAKQNRSLTGKSMSALKWNLGGMILLSLQFAIGINIAGLLWTGADGLVGIARFVQGLGNTFAKGQPGKAISRKQSISEQYFLTKTLHAFAQVLICQN